MAAQIAISNTLDNKIELNKGSNQANLLIEASIEKVKNASDNILELNEIKDPLIRNNILMIIKYVNKFPDLFSDYKTTYGELFTKELNTIRLKYNHSKYINDFFTIIYKNSELGVNYQNVLNNKGDTEFKEGLLRIGGIKNFNHIDYLEMHNNLGKSIYVFYNILNRIFKDISEGNVEGEISINVDVKDMQNKNFFKIIKLLKDKYNIDLSKQKIIFEILETEKLPNTPEFREKILKLKNLGFKIALDDILSEKVTLEDVLKNLNFAGNNLDMIKIDGKMLQSFYSIYKTAYGVFGKGFSDLKEIFSKITSKGVKIVAEWIEDLDMLNFAKNVLGINFFQGFFSNKEENVKILQSNSQI